jgi:hypothetical protein
MTPTVHSPTIPPDEFALLAESGSLLRLHPGQVLFRQGDPCFSIYWVTDGEVEVSQEPSDTHPIPRPVCVLGSGEVVGEFALFSENGRRTDTVRAATQGAWLLELPVNPIEMLRDHMGDPLAGFRLLRALMVSTVYRFWGAMGEAGNREDRPVVGGHGSPAMDDAVCAVLAGIDRGRRWWQRRDLREWSTGRTIEPGWIGDRVALVASGGGEIQLTNWHGAKVPHRQTWEFRGPLLVPLGRRGGMNGLPGIRIRIQENSEGRVFRWSRFGSRNLDPGHEDFLALHGVARMLVAQIQDLEA